MIPKKPVSQTAPWLFLALALAVLCGRAQGQEKEVTAMTDLPDFNELWDFNDLAGTEAKFREILPLAHQSGDLGYLAELMTQIARTQGLQGKSPAAHETLDQVESILTPALVKARVRYLLERGRATNGIPGATDAEVGARKEKSKPFFEEAWDVGKEGGELALALDAAHMMGIVESPARGLEWNLKAIELAESTDDEKAGRWLGPLYNNTGWSYHDKGDFEKALDMFERDIAFRKKTDQIGPMRISRWSKGRALRSLGRVEEALKIQEELSAERETIGEPSGYVFEEIGECLKELGRGEDSKKWFGMAYDLLSKDDWVVKNEADKLKRLKELGGVGQ